MLSIGVIFCNTVQPLVELQLHLTCCHTVKLFHSKNIDFGTIFLHYQYFLIAYKNHDSKIFNILGIQHKNQMRGQEAA